eukprot:COSAG01_NODE_282_length_19505_cov_101.588117_3_plen_553_part_00
MLSLFSLSLKSGAGKSSSRPDRSRRQHAHTASQVISKAQQVSPQYIHVGAAAGPAAAGGGGRGRGRSCTTGGKRCSKGGGTGTPAGDDTVWRFDDAPRGYQAYGEAEQAALSAAHSAGITALSLTSGHWTYSIDLSAMEQTNVQTGKKRAIRMPCGGATGAAAEEGVPPQAIATKGKCPAGAECELYRSFLRYDFTEIGYHHMTSCEHPMVPCWHGKDCRAHTRLCGGGREFRDVCHCCIYTHGRADRATWPEGVVSMAVHKWDAETAGELVLYKGLSGEADRISEELRARGEARIRGELRAHGLEHEMSMLGHVVPTLRRHPRLAQAQMAESNTKGSGGFLGGIQAQGVLDIELFALLLYTGSEAQGMIRKALRAPADDLASITGWQWTLHAIKHAVMKLSETPPKWLYHGLNGVSMKEEDYRVDTGYGMHYHMFSYANLISTSMSMDMATTFAIGAGGTVAAADVKTVGSVLCFDTEVGSYEHERVYADLRWISKFPDEQEWLMIPLHSASIPCVDTTNGFVNRTAELDGPGGVRVKVDYFNCKWESADW